MLPFSLRLISLELLLRYDRPFYFTNLSLSISWSLQFLFANSMLLICCFLLYHFLISSYFSFFEECIKFIIKTDIRLYIVPLYFIYMFWERSRVLFATNSFFNQPRSLHNLSYNDTITSKWSEKDEKLRKCQIKKNGQRVLKNLLLCM